MMTEYSENMSIVMTENGRKSYHFETPLIEGYNLARDPYREFRKGIKITTYTNDSLAAEDAVLRPTTPYITRTAVFGRPRATLS